VKNSPDSDPGRLVLGIETSCDETAAAVVASGRQVLASLIASQIKDHAPYGGVVPEIASRRHIQNILPLVDITMQQAGLTLQDLSGIAVTQGPGLLGSLLTGFSWAKAAAFAAGLPIVGVSHLEGHLYALELTGNPPPFPHLALLVSGGHTSIYLARDSLTRTELGRTVDDAAGEAFDKAGKLLGLDYPGGAAIDHLARQGNRLAYEFPRPLAHDGSLNFSFSGFKTAVWHFRQSHSQDYISAHMADICASAQEAIVDVLIRKMLAATRQTGVKHWTLSGGVACNSRLREVFRQTGREQGLGVSLAPPEFCTDNAAMIAAAGANALRAGRRLDEAADAVSRLPRGGALP
jgi:N6-L-threonylcarbamoyladenine synthase